MFWSGSLRRFADRCGRSARSAGNGCNFTVWRLFLGGDPYRLERIGTGATRERAPASVSAPVRELLRCGLGFTGWIMADDPARPNSPVRRGSAYFQAESEKTHGQSSPLRRVRSPSRTEWCCKRFKIRCKNEIISGVNRRRMRKGSSECGARPMRRIGTHGTRGL